MKLPLIGVKASHGGAGKGLQHNYRQSKRTMEKFRSVAAILSLLPTLLLNLPRQRSRLFLFCPDEVSEVRVVLLFLLLKCGYLGSVHS